VTLPVVLRDEARAEFDEAGVADMARKSVRQQLARRCCIALMVAVAVVGLLLIVRPRSRFGREQFERLREGMTEAEVIAVLGCPPGDYRPKIWSQPDWYVSTSDPIGFLLEQRGRSLQQLREWEQLDLEEWVRAGKPIPVPPDRAQKASWWARHYGIDVAFDRQGRVIHLSLWELNPPRPPHDIWRWIRWWLGW
jgi:hypothetical protein